MKYEHADEPIHTLDLRKEIEIDAPIEVTWAAVLEELGPGSVMPDGTPFPFVLEAWPGGRWFRDLGNKTGHFWGHVQVIKPPTLLELSGPMFMSYPAMNFVQYRLAKDGDGTRLTLCHRALGLITEEHKTGVQKGWQHGIERISLVARAKASKLATSGV